MRELGILIKNNYYMLLGSIQGKKHRKSTVYASTLLILGIVALVALYTYEANSMFVGLGKQNGLYNLVFFHGILTSVCIAVVIGVMRISAKSKTNDTDILLSLPIKKIYIVLAKTINKYVFDFFFESLLFTPYYILYLVYTGFNVQTLLICIEINFTLPLFSVGLSYVLNFLVERICAKLKSGNFIKSIFTSIIFILVLALLLLKTSFYGTVTETNMENYFSDRFFSNTILQMILTHNIKYLVIYLCLTIGTFTLGVTLFSINYGKTFASFHSKSTTFKFNEPKSMFKNLYKKELNTYLSTPAYITNTIIGPALMLVFSILLASLGISGIESMFGISIENKTILTAILTLLFCVMTASTVISSCSISLESHNLWIIKSSPIDEIHLINAKALLHISIMFPAILISAIICTLSLSLPFTGFIIMTTLPLLLTAVIAYGGLLINIWLPNLDWDDETKVVKQSLSVLITMIFSLIISLLPLLMILIFDNITLSILYISAYSIYIILLGLVQFVLFTKGIKQFRKLA